MPTVAPADGLVLVVDLGSGGPKVGVATLAGELWWSTHAPVVTRRPEPGASVQDAEQWWRLIVDAARRVFAERIVAPERVVAVSCTGQWGSTVPVADDGAPVGDCVMYDDTRGAPYVRPIIAGPAAGYAPRAVLEWIRKTAGAPSRDGADPIGHMLFLQASGSPARWFLEPVDYLTMRFTGIAAASHASMIAAWLTDNRHLDVLDYDDGLLRRAGIDPARLPPLRPAGTIVGPMLDAVADELGVPRGLPVVGGLPDLHSAACGAGAMGDFQAHLAISTTSWIGLPVPFKRTDVLRSIATVPGVGSARYLVANNQETAGRCLQWLRDSVFDGALSYDELIAAAAVAPPASRGLIFTPWLAGERSPVDDRNARGGFHNLSVDHERGDLVRAVLEGVACNSRWLLSAVERFAKRRLEPIRLIGTGATADLWGQIVADVLDRRVERVADPGNTNLRGQALVAGMALGAVREDAVRELVVVDRVFEPQRDHRAVYDRCFDEFRRLYRSQRKMFARLNGRR